MEQTLGRIPFGDRAGGPDGPEPPTASQPVGAHPLRGEPFTVLSLFAGIGGFDLGLERTGGFRTVAFCEIDPFCQRVLAKHWPGVPIYDDVRTLTAEQVGPVDVICGGFPCQDISTAGKGAGLAGERSGLWSEYARLIGELRPFYVIVENVAALLGRGLGAVLGDLASIGYDAEWHCIPASAVGAPHIRDRLWIIAYPQHPDADSIGPHREALHVNGSGQPAHQQVRFAGPLRQILAHAHSGRGRADVAGRNDADWTNARRSQANGLPGTVCDPSGAGHVADAHCERSQGRGIPVAAEWDAGADAQRSSPRKRWHPARQGGWWATEPAVGRVAHGVRNRVDRLRSLGNAVVPQIPELIGRAILEARAA